VRDKHFDKTLGGLDWNAVRARYEPLVLAAPDAATFYRLLNQMLGELGQSHLEVAGPGAPSSPAFDPDAPPSAGGEADTGLVVRIIEGRPTITAVRPESPAERAGLRPGFIVTHIGGWEVATRSRGGRPLRPVEERFYARVAAARRLTGPAGTRVTVKYLDAQDRPGRWCSSARCPTKNR
jgi:C-terminal processing protease CtpA/Prc